MSFWEYGLFEICLRFIYYEYVFIFCTAKYSFHVSIARRKVLKKKQEVPRRKLKAAKEVFAPCYRCCSVDFWPILTRDDSWTSIPRIWSDNGVGPTKIEVEKRSEQMVSVMSHFQLSLLLSTSDVLIGRRKVRWSHGYFDTFVSWFKG